FLAQSVEMATKDRDLIKPSLISVGVSIAVAVVGSLPIIAAALLFGNSTFGEAALFVLGALLIFAQFVVSYIFAGMTVYLIYGYLAEGDGRMDKAWEAVKGNLWHIVALAAASTLVKVLENTLRGRGRRSLIGGLVASLIETVWTTATYFVLPAMIIEDLDLGKALKRATYMIKNNLLLVAVSEIGVSGIVGFITFVLVFGAIVLGLGIVVSFSGVGGGIGLGVGIALAVLVGGTVIALATAAGSYVTTAYHTCLFLWARDAEKARAADRDVRSVAAPAPVAAVLGA
ncbi:MAG: hypothetical protein HY023_08670, partial [Chloroflexi bacterium]|nr:hypothetical protein [Chloroflexota bacterium]